MVLFVYCNANSFVGNSKVRSNIRAKKNIEPIICLTKVFSFLANSRASSSVIAIYTFYLYYISGTGCRE